ncbi:hypothetical protein ACB092_02G103100 [Castanea dentata]
MPISKYGKMSSHPLNFKFHLFLRVSLLIPPPSASLFLHADLHKPNRHRPITANPRFNQPSSLTHAPPSTHSPSHFIFFLPPLFTDPTPLPHADSSRPPSPKSQAYPC